MEDLIYLVILIAWAVFAFYRQSQKKKAAARAEEAQPAPPQPIDERRQRSWEDILFGEEVMEENEPEPEQEALPQDLRKYTAYEPISLEQLHMHKKAESLEDPRVQQRMEKEKASLLKKQKQKAETTEKQHPLLEDFDLRKAVIFSEILRRPYD